eukprot:PITA_24042
MKALFSSQDIWDLVKNGFQEPARVATYNALSQEKRDLLRDNRKNDANALFYIFQAVHESVFPRVAATTKSKQSCDTLQTTYQGMAKVKTTKLQMLRRYFETLCMKFPENVDSFFTHVEAQQDHILEEEKEAHTEVEEAFQAQVEDAAIKIQVKAQAKIKHKVIGMINLKSNLITVRSMVIMKMNVGRSNTTLLEEEKEVHTEVEEVAFQTQVEEAAIKI